MTEQIKAEQIPIINKLALNDIDFDNIDDNELQMIKEEIEVIVNIRRLKHERMVFVKKKIIEEKNELRNKMLKDLKREKQNIIESYKKEAEEAEAEEESNEEDSDIVSVIYNKKTPKGKVTKAKRVVKKK
jgi:thymidylate synthase ThyX